jgi:hypothetical protein
VTRRLMDKTTCFSVFGQKKMRSQRKEKKRRPHDMCPEMKKKEMETQDKKVQNTGKKKMMEILNQT